MRPRQRMEDLPVEAAGGWGVGVLLLVELASVVVFWCEMVGPVSWVELQKLFQGSKEWWWSLAGIAALLMIALFRARREDARPLERAEPRVRPLRLPSRPPPLPHSPRFHPHHRRAG